jgi:hypothetical protein
MMPNNINITILFIFSPFFCVPPDLRIHDPPTRNKGLGSGLRRRPRCDNVTIKSGRITRDGLEHGGPVTLKRPALQYPLPDMDGEYEADARRLIRLRSVDDRWRRIDRLLVVPTRLMPAVVATGLMPAALLVPAPSIVISGEGRRNGHTADH